MLADYMAVIDLNHKMFSSYNQTVSLMGLAVFEG